MTASFYQHYWKVVAKSVTLMIWKFFDSGSMLKQLNFTYLALLPKLTNPTKVAQFRPIALCNVCYKIIAKLLANRLKTLLPKLISSVQSAFVPGRPFQDNSICASEVIHSMKRKTGRSGLIALKMDMAQAYDRLEWNSILFALQCFGFSPTWIQLIHQCISTVSYSLLLNGSPFGRFTPSRGLRQGDPLSPFLFILTSEALSRLFLKAERLGLIHGIKASRRSPAITHLSFADDLLVLCRANLREAHEVDSLLKVYCDWSGQSINNHKSSIYFSPNTFLEVQSAISRALMLPKMKKTSKYLGMPLFWGRDKSKHF